ncbi:MAG: hypothetical protein ACJA2E_002028 [Arenicella sp.]
MPATTIFATEIASIAPEAQQSDVEKSKKFTVNRPRVKLMKVG